MSGSHRVRSIAAAAMESELAPRGAPSRRRLQVLQVRDADAHPHRGHRRSDGVPPIPFRLHESLRGRRAVEAWLRMRLAAEDSLVARIRNAEGAGIRRAQDIIVLTPAVGCQTAGGRTLRARGRCVRMRVVRVHRPTLGSASANDAFQEHGPPVTGDGVVMARHVAVDPVPHRSPDCRITMMWREARPVPDLKKVAAVRIPAFLSRRFERGQSRCMGR
jgi:hypothetical protein